MKAICGLFWANLLGDKAKGLGLGKFTKERFKYLVFTEIFPKIYFERYLFLKNSPKTAAIENSLFCDSESFIKVVHENDL